MADNEIRQLVSASNEDLLCHGQEFKSYSKCDRKRMESVDLRSDVVWFRY